MSDIRASGSEIVLMEQTMQMAICELKKHEDANEVLSAEGHDMKTLADHRVESVIVENLSQSSSYKILAEEKHADTLLEDGKRYWVIDPLDGTVNFTRGIPHYAISIGLWEAPNTPLFGMIYDGCTKQVYQGGLGSPSRRGGERIQVSEVSDKDQAILATGFPLLAKTSEDAMHDFWTRAHRYKKIRMFGAACTSMIYVATGLVDAYRETGTRLWDVAAGLAIHQAAGGIYELNCLDKSRHVYEVDARSPGLAAF